MISKERKKALKEMYSKDRDGIWKNYLSNDEEKKFILNLDYMYYSGIYSLIGDILENIENQLEKSEEFISKEFETYLNCISEELTYSEYKNTWRLLENPNDIEALNYLCRSVKYSDSTEKLYEWIEARLADAVHNPSNDVKEVDTYDERYPTNPIYTGYEINGFEFITAYTGIAGKYWNTVCKW